MKKISLVCFSMVFVFLACSAVLAEGEKVCKTQHEHIKVGPITIYKGQTKKIWKNHTSTYGGLFNFSDQYQIKFDHKKAFYTTNSLFGVNTIEATTDRPPYFVEFEVLNYDDQKIVFYLKRFEASKCYNPNIRLQKVGG